MSGNARESLWVLRAQSGDREALDMLFRALSPAPLGYLRRVAPSHADDLLQDVLLIVYRKLGYLRDPALHVLLLLASLLIYGTLAMGLVTLGAHVNRCTLRVLKALELSQPDGGPRVP